jgi:membrane-associated PAP2 superfamily phosphatase
MKAPWFVGDSSGEFFNQYGKNNWSNQGSFANSITIRLIKTQAIILLMASVCRLPAFNVRNRNHLETVAPLALCFVTLAALLRGCAA